MNDIFVEKIYTKKAINRVRTKIMLLGSFNKMDAIEFMNTRLIVCFIVFFLTLIFSEYAYIAAPLMALGVYFGLEFIFIDVKIKKRQSKLENDALFFFEVLTLSLETGRNLKGSLELTVRNIDSELSREFAYALDTITYGKTLNEALTDMKKKIPSDTINNVILNITHSNVHGSEIVNTLYAQVDYLRDKRLFEAKARIAKMPVKISIISVLFFVPIIMLLLLGPVVLNLLG